jgi:hypothetical protein
MAYTSTLEAATGASALGASTTGAATGASTTGAGASATTGAGAGAATGVTTGALIALPACLLAKLFKKKVIYIESFARVTDGNRTGKLIYKFADLFIYQWEQLASIYPNGVYGGGIY